MCATAEETEIPNEWRTATCQGLRIGTIGREIEQTVRSRRDWEAAFPAAFGCDLVAALLQTLSRSAVRGKQVLLEEPGETWEFFFYHEERKMYGKVCLRLCGKRIKIISSH